MSDKPYLAKTPIFILGVAPKVGTNYLQNMLCLHRSCASFPVHEDFMVYTLPKLVHYPKEVVQQYRAQNREWKFRKEYLDLLENQMKVSLGESLVKYINLVSMVPRRRVVLKTPWTHGAAEVSQFFKSVPMLLLIRDGRATVESMSKWIGWSFEKCLKIWTESAEELVRFQARPPKQAKYLIIRYEQLYRSNTVQLKRIFRFLELSTENYPFDKARRLPVHQSSFFKPYSNSRTREFATYSSFSTWNTAQRRRFNSVAGKAQKALGYDLA